MPRWLKWFTGQNLITTYIKMILRYVFVAQNRHIHSVPETHFWQAQKQHVTLAYFLLPFHHEHKMIYCSTSFPFCFPKFKVIFSTTHLYTFMITGKPITVISAYPILVDRNCFLLLPWKFLINSIHNAAAQSPSLYKMPYQTVMIH